MKSNNSIDKNIGRIFVLSRKLDRVGRLCGIAREVFGDGSTIESSDYFNEFENAVNGRLNGIKPDLLLTDGTCYFFDDCIPIGPGEFGVGVCKSGVWSYSFVMMPACKKYNIQIVLARNNFGFYSEESARDKLGSFKI